MKYQILICDDEPEIIELLALYFDSEIYDIHPAHNGKRALEILQEEAIDLALIDIMMPELNGLDLIRLVREQLDIPLIIISALDSLSDKLKGYDIGADDYIVKPFESMEVLAKVKSRLKKQKNKVEKIERDGVILDLQRCQVEVIGKISDLTKVEFAVLQLLMNEPMRVFTKEQIYHNGWDEDYLYNDNSIRVIINRIRSLVGEKHIETIRGIGYRWRS